MHAFNWKKKISPGNVEEVPFSSNNTKSAYILNSSENLTQSLKEIENLKTKLIEAQQQKEYQKLNN